jgi:hypothetical protein
MSELRRCTEKKEKDSLHLIPLVGIKRLQGVYRRDGELDEKVHLVVLGDDVVGAAWHTRVGRHPGSAQKARAVFINSFFFCCNKIAPFREEPAKIKKK